MADESHDPQLTRAAVLRGAAVGAAGLAIAGARPGGAAFAASTPELAAAAQAFLGSLEPGVRARATFPFADAERVRWHWTMPAVGAAQRAAARRHDRRAAAARARLLRREQLGGRLPEVARHHQAAGRPATQDGGGRLLVRPRPLLRDRLRRARRRRPGAGGSRDTTSRGTSPSSATGRASTRSSSARGRHARRAPTRGLPRGYRTMPREEDAARELVRSLGTAASARARSSSREPHRPRDAERRAAVSPLEPVGVRVSDLTSSGAAPRSCSRSSAPTPPSSGGGRRGASTGSTRRASTGSASAGPGR